MRPWHFSHGNYLLDPRDPPPYIASMRPWHFSHGNILSATSAAASGLASMRPWHFSHGNQYIPLHLVLAISGFNEAVAFQPRKFIHQPTFLQYFEVLQ